MNDRPIQTSDFVTYVINMEEASDRLSHMTRELARIGLSFIRYPGVAGDQLTHPHKDFSDWSYRHLHGRRWAPREVGCYLSHIGCMQQFLRSGAKYALILEDDVVIDDDLPLIINDAINVSTDWNMLRLSTVNSGKWWPVTRIGRYHLSVCLSREKGAGGYLVDRKAAEQMVKLLLPMRLAWDIAFDLEWLLGFKTLGVHPMPINQQTGFATQIQQDRCDIKLTGNRKYITVLPFRACLEISRAFYRLYRLATVKYLRGRDPLAVGSVLDS